MLTPPPPPHPPYKLHHCLLKDLTTHFACIADRYPTTVATLSRRARDRIEAAFEQSVEGGAANPLLASRLHDFGFRGCTCVEQSVLGGVAHLLNFDGSDTLSAAYYAQVRLQHVLSPVQVLIQVLLCFKCMSDQKKAHQQEHLCSWYDSLRCNWSACTAHSDSHLCIAADSCSQLCHALPSLPSLHNISSSFT